MKIIYPCAALTLILLSILALPATARNESFRHVLIMHSYHPGMTWVDNMDRGIRDELMVPPYENIIIHTEYMDTKRHHSPEYYDRLLHIYKEKYNDIYLDLIMATDNNAFDFLLKYKNVLFRSAPVVFGGVNNFSDASIRDRDDFTGVIEVVSFRETLEVILRQFPDTKEIFVINDYLNSGRAWAVTIKQKQKPFEDKLRFIHNQNLSVEDLQEEIRSLKPGTVVLFGAYYADNSGRYLTYEKIGSLLTKTLLCRFIVWRAYICGIISSAVNS